MFNAIKVCIYTDNQERAIEFYTKKLGFEIAELQADARLCCRASGTREPALGRPTTLRRRFE